MISFLKKKEKRVLNIPANLTSAEKKEVKQMIDRARKDDGIDNNLDGVINNLPEQKPVSQISTEDVIEAEQRKKSILKKLQESVPEPEKMRSVHGCIICAVPERV